MPQQPAYCSVRTRPVIARAGADVAAPPVMPAFLCMPPLSRISVPFTSLCCCDFSREQAHFRRTPFRCITGGVNYHGEFAGSLPGRVLTWVTKLLSAVLSAAQGGGRGGGGSVLFILRPQATSKHDTVPTSGLQVLHGNFKFLGVNPPTKAASFSADTATRDAFGSLCEQQCGVVASNLE